VLLIDIIVVSPIAERAGRKAESLTPYDPDFLVWGERISEETTERTDGVLGSLGRVHIDFEVRATESCPVAPEEFDRQHR